MNINKIAAYMEYIHHIIDLLVTFVKEFGYIGLFIMCFLESTFAPIPSEITLIPAGYLIQQGVMNVWMVLFCCITGTMAGSYFNYWLAMKYGRPILLRYGKYCFINESKMQKAEDFFSKHGSMSIFTGRLVIGVRHFISFPAGLSHMPLRPFFLYTFLGGALWTIILVTLGYFLGSEKDAVGRYAKYIAGGVSIAVIAGLAFYLWRHKKKHGSE